MTATIDPGLHLTPASPSAMFPGDDPCCTAWRAAHAMGPVALRGLVAASGLRDERGELVVDSWERCVAASRPGDGRCLVVRALDTEVGMVARTVLLARSAATVVEGACIAASAIAAVDVVIAVDAEREVSALRRAVDDLHHGAPDVLPRIRVHALDAQLMDADDLALVRHLEGRPVMSALTPPTVEARGLEGAPTVVHTPETLCNLVALLHGRPVTALWHVTGAVVRPGLVEVAPHVTLGSLLDVCGGTTTSLRFVVVGGVTGSLAGDAELDLPIVAGAAGARTIVVGGETTCVVDTVHGLADQLARHNCGRCVACRDGSFQFATILADHTRGRAAASDEGQLREIAEHLRTTALCAIGVGGAQPVLDLLDRFAVDLDAHRRKTCAALACTAYRTIHILADRCTGCEQCVEPCPEDAIDGDEGYIHVIDADACTSCGICIPICPEQAIFAAGPKKPKTPKQPVPVGSWKR